MYKFIANVRIKNQLVKTVVFADSQIHARLIIQYLYGFSSLVNTPIQVNEVSNLIKPMSPQQSRINALKVAKSNATKALKAEKNRQKITKAQQTISNAMRSS
jgi:hypothetical protein